MKNFIKKQVMLVLATFALVGVVLVSSSYALFQKTFVDTKTQSISLGDLSIVFSNGTIVDGVYQELSDSNAITLNNLMPQTDSEAIADNSNVYNFVIHNGGTLAYSYTIKLQDDEDQTNTLSHNYIRYKINDEQPWLLGNTTNDIIYEYVINPGESHTFTLKVWLAEAEKYQVPDSALGASAYLRINIEGEAANIRAPKGWKYAEEGTLLYAIKSNETLHKDTDTGMTVPGQAINNGNEGLRETRDDYGTSYYYRGAVENNYVLFAGKCWRIVRIDGNGNIKIVFENDANNCSSQSNAGTSFFNRPAGVCDNNTGIGFMYGVGNSNNLYDATTGEHANLHDSNILEYLKTWYDGVFTTDNLKNMLADVIWCGDKTLSYSTSGTGLGSAYTQYGTYRRLYDSAPSLICPTSVAKTSGTYNGTTFNIGSLSKYTAESNTDSNNAGGNGMLKTVDGNTTKYYKVGLLTADEVTFAGAYRGTDNNNYYLFNNTHWWTMSPYVYGFNVGSRRLSNVCEVSSTGRLDYTFVDNIYEVRPSVSLKYDVSATYSTAQNADAPGTATNPFVIVEN